MKKQDQNNMKKKQIQKACKHDHKNAIKVGNIDYMCPLCKKIIDPMEWFFMNSFEFVDVQAEIASGNKVSAKRGGNVAGNARKKTEKDICAK